MTIETLRSSNCIIFECVSGSKAYGLELPSSDTDIKGVFLLPLDKFYATEYIPQISDDSNDTVYYELGRFIELCLKANPTCLEMLATPDDCILYRNELFSYLTLELFLSKRCYYSFAKYAETQMKKARGMKRKILNPIPKERKGILDFCFAYENGKTVPLQEMLLRAGMTHEECGASRVPNMPMCYNVYWGNTATTYKGLVRGEHTGDLVLSNIAQGESPQVLIYFNKDVYSAYCKQYREYWSWVEKRNQRRFADTSLEGRNYDSKNMMHTFRLLLTAQEIALKGKLNVRRSDRTFLLEIRNGKYSYEELLDMSDKILGNLPTQFDNSVLPAEPNRSKAETVLVAIRKAFYKPFHD